MARRTTKATNNSSLFAAIETGSHTEVLITLMSNPDVNQLNSDGITPLMAAVDKDDFSIVLTLLRDGADPNAVDPRGRSVLARAILRANQPGGRDLTMTLRVWGAR